MANALAVQTTNVLVVMARIAATESIAKIRSVASTAISTTNNKVATRRLCTMVKKRASWQAGRSG